MQKLYFELKIVSDFFQSYLRAGKIIRQQHGDLLFCFHGFRPSFGSETIYFQTPHYELSWTLNFLQKYYQIVTVEDLLSEPTHESSLLKKAAITIDDGFTSILNVMDIFRKFKVVPMIFICPGLIDRNTIPFPEMIRAAIFSSLKSEIHWPGFKGIIPLRGYKNKLYACSTVIEIFKKYID